MEKCCRPWTCFRKHVLDRLLGIVLVHHTIFVMVVGSTFQMHLRVLHMKPSLVVKRNHLTGRCEGLAEEGEQQDDCEQSAHEMGKHLRSGRMIAADSLQPHKSLFLVLPSNNRQITRILRTRELYRSSIDTDDISEHVSQYYAD